MRLGKTVGAVAAFTFGLALGVHAADVTGKWKSEFDTQIGVQKYTFDLKAADGKLTGTAQFERMGQQGQVELTEGKLDGDKISFVEQMDMQGMPLRIEYSGQVVGDEMKLTRKVGEFATEQIVAKRVKE
jgi:hypothetical protein